MPSVPHLAVPFRVENGKVAVVEQGGHEEIAACMLASLSTRLGSRVEAPEYGTPSQLFRRQVRTPSADVYVRAVEKDEPRAAALGTAEIENLVERVTVAREAGG